MRAKFIYEVFKDESDPIHDMGIGGFDPSQEFDRLRKEFLKSWVDYLKSLDIIGKKLTGNFRRSGINASLIKQTTGIIKDIKIDSSLQIEHQGLRFIDEEGTSYYYLINDGGKIFIE
jgi:hypothetical protein